MNNEEIKTKLKEFFMSDLGVDGSMLNFDTPLFGEEIGLDSVDSLEIISFVDDAFGVSMTGVGKEHFQSIDTIAAYIKSNQG
ncbi:MAG: acyl carrier protein [Fibrobacter sp.]|mgnify:FL=1|jgi:acyl carrier protein|uniref:acyl carrier protein n=1 Tax=Fibrobacter sp. UWP2 TaxID=1896216 RepID=UPI00090EFF25|nr:acyl carrier protein [Fibrobacter sp. UWP2]MBO7383943.1 acyl carrier protein [Fibrobacter sp.]MCR5377889.1 acyl carrier protein [Fibrobacter sp.]SHJ08282.1 acyl carrier protein [Fibrobacter sp. UWP2]